MTRRVWEGMVILRFEDFCKPNVLICGLTKLKNCDFSVLELTNNICGFTV
jgi:hypothetical protein